MSRKGWFAVVSMVIVGVTAVVGVAAWTALASTKQITPAFAHEACQQLFQETKSQIAAVRGYAVVASGTNCNPEQDEEGQTDYTLSSYFLIRKRNVVDDTISKADVDAVARSLPDTDYPWDMSNDLTPSGGAQAVCLVASKYLNNDGRYIDQGRPGTHETFNDLTLLTGYTSRCAKGQ